MRKTLSISLICAVVSYIVIYPTPIYAVDKKEIVQIAYQGPLTGPENSIGQSELEAVKYAVSIFNDFYQGQISVQLKTIDDQGNPAIAMKVAPTTAADSDVIGLIGPAYSAASIASLPSYKESSLPMISPSASRADLTNPYSPVYGAPVFHRVVSVEKQKGERLNSWAIQGVSNPRIFVVTDSFRPTEWLTTLAPSAIRAGVLNMNDYYGKDSTVISIILNSNPNILVIDSFETKPEILLSLRKLGFNGKIIATDNWAYEPNIQAARYSLEGLQFVELTTSSLQEIDSRLESEYLSITSKASNIFALQTIDATNVFLSCIASGVRTRLKMLDCVKAFTGKSITGELFSFDKFGDSTNPFLRVSTITQGQIVREKFTLKTEIPLLGNPVTTKDGFQIEILNYESKSNYWIKSSIGTIKRNGNLISVSILEPGQTASVSVATSLQLLKFNSITMVGKAGLTPEQIEKETKLAVEKILAEANAKAEAIRDAQKLEEAKIEAEQKLAEARALAEKIITEAKSSIAKKTTINCVKGKLIKQVTAVKPKCPAGYKIKK